MKKIAFIICFLAPFMSSAATIQGSKIDTFQELCAKEKDPIKRQNYCHILDRHNSSFSNIIGSHKDVVTV